MSSAGSNSLPPRRTQDERRSTTSKTDKYRPNQSYTSTPDPRSRDERWSGNDSAPRPKSALKREGSRSRVPSARPDFPDEESYLGSNAPDLERKNRPAERRFREKRDGYESEEGERHRAARGQRRGGRYDDDDDYSDESDGAPRRRRDHDRYEQPESSTRSRRDQDKDASRQSGGRAKSKGRDDDRYEPLRRRNTEREPTRRTGRRRDDDYSDSGSDDEDYRPRRRRSAERVDEVGRSNRPRDREYKSEREDRDARKRREEIYENDRVARKSDKSRRRRSADGRYDDRDRGRDDRDVRRREPREIRIGKYDIGPYVEQGQKHYKTYAPILTPIVMNLAKNYMSGRR